MSKAKVYKTYNWIIKTLIILAAVYFLYNQFFVKNTWEELQLSFTELIAQNRFVLFLIPVFLLMPVNWLLEALKWQKIVSAKERLSLWTSLKAIFAGVTISSISVNRTGEFLGRIFVLKKHSFWEGAVVNLVGSYAQTWNTFFWGGLSGFILSLPYAQGLNTLNSFFYYAFFVLLFLTLIIALFLYYKISWANQLVAPRHKRIRKVIDILHLVETSTLNRVLWLSAIRYFVFSSQFYLLMRGASVEINIWTGYMLISLMFLFNTIRPSIALIEIGLRSASALYIFELYYISFLGESTFPQVEITAVSSFIWLINIVLPSILGLFFVKDLRFFKAKKK
jgi:hypothetical protein